MFTIFQNWQEASISPLSKEISRSAAMLERLLVDSELAAQVLSDELCLKFLELEIEIEDEDIYGLHLYNMLRMFRRVPTRVSILVRSSNMTDEAVIRARRIYVSRASARLCAMEFRGE